MPRDSASASDVGRPLVVGANHRSSSMTLRDRLFVEESAAPAFLKRLSQLGIEQAMVLSTCDRVEVQAIATSGDGAEKRIKKVMAEHAELNPGDLGDQIYVLWDEDAVRQIFTVTASLDSLMIGEPQVLGQVKDSHRLAREAKMSGGGLEALFQAAFAAAKRVRSETAIGQRPVSMAAVATQLARNVHGDLSGCSGL
ncbi:MAG TPA: glutamyl-tRNA reductase, partial [Rhodospirillales bacterium]|nr:glutamyl-tRNA reductase [Rhodospirillales bacterium]